MLTPDDLTTIQSGEGPWADHPLHNPLTLALNFPWKLSGSVSLLSTDCPGLLAQHLRHMLPFLHHNVGSVDGLHSAGARISSGVQKLHAKGYRSFSRTWSIATPRHLTSYEWNKRRQRTAGKSGQHPQLRCQKSQGNKTCYCKRRERRSPSTHDPDLCWGVRPTQLPDPTPEVTCGYSWR